MNVLLQVTLSVHKPLPLLACSFPSSSLQETRLEHFPLGGLSHAFGKLSVLGTFHMAHLLLSLHWAAFTRVSVQWLEVGHGTSFSSLAQTKGLEQRKLLESIESLKKVRLEISGPDT